jgi:hypothetical protein
MMIGPEEAPPREPLAYHEAGHAGMAITLRFDVVSASIRPDWAEKSWGRCQTRCPQGAPLAKHIAVLQAGVLAEAVCRAQYELAGCDGVSGLRDRQECEALMVALTRGQRDELNKRVSLACNAITSWARYWRGVSAIAKVLIDKEELPFMQARRIFKSGARDLSSLRREAGDLLRDAAGDMWSFQAPAIDDV